MSASGHLRLFIAIYPPPEVARRLIAGLGRLELPAHRAVPAEQVHLTVHFVGGVADAELPRITETLERARAGIERFALRPDRLITLPPRGRKRLVAAEADGPPPLLELQRRLAGRLSPTPRRRPGDRFRPHFTLCRFKKETAMPSLEEPIDVGAFEVSAIALMKSVLRPDGAQHTPVAQCELG